MKIKLKYSAFTLLELTIAMLISAICMGIAFYVLSTFTKTSLTQQTQKQKNFAFQLFHQRMVKEAWQSDYIWINDNILQFERQDQWTSYHFLDSIIVRFQQEVPTDTIHAVTYDTELITIEGIQEKPVLSYSFTVQTKEGIYPILLKKEYSAEELLNLTRIKP